MNLEIPAQQGKLDNEPVPTGWFNLPFEMREMVMNEMDYKTLFVFAQCSKLCAKEVKASKRLKLKISLRRSTSASKHPKLYVGRAEDDDRFLYFLTFVQMASSDTPKTEVIYFKSTRKHERIEKWRRVENDNAEEVRVRYLDDYIDEYNKNIDKIEIHDDEFPTSKYDMRKLNNLGRIEDSTQCDLLKSEVFDFSQIINAEQCVSPGTNVTLKQIVELKGWNYEFKSDELNEAKIRRLLKMYRKAKLNPECLELDLNLPCFPNVYRILDGVDVDDVEEDYVCHFGRSLEIVFFDSKRRWCECTLSQKRMRMIVQTKSSESDESFDY